MNTFGRNFRLTTWGESHGPCIGGVIDGIPSNFPLCLESIQKALDRRRPGSNIFVSSREEEDKIEILSGIFEGKTLGTPLAFLIKNKDMRSQDYDHLRHVFRPGHGDFVYQMKYKHRDHRGGGRASARETAVRVAGGAIALQVLQKIHPKIEIICGVIQIGNLKIEKLDLHSVYKNSLFCPDPSQIKKWEAYLQTVRNENRSVGAILEVHATEVPIGLGDPIYGKLDADLAHAFMSINATKGVEVGEGFSSVNSTTSYDEMDIDERNNPIFYSNHAGGIVAGISTGQPIVCRIAFKPTTSTARPRKTITEDFKPTIMSIEGRHDPCVGIRAVPIVEAMMALVLLDHIL